MSALHSRVPRAAPRHQPRAGPRPACPRARALSGALRPLAAPSSSPSAIREANPNPDPDPTSDGGGVQYLDSIEAIDLSAPERGWRVAAQLPHPRAFAAACLGPDRCLYVLGGTENGSSSRPTVLRWDPRAEHVHQLAPMRSARAHFAGAFGPDGRIYVAGGFEWTGMLTSAEVYDPRLDCWTDLPEMGANMELCAGAFVW